MWKSRQLGLFMTSSDEKLFCEELRKVLPNIYFLNTKPTKDGNIDKRLVSCVSEEHPFSNFSIVNFDLVDKEELAKRYKIIQGYYHYAQIGVDQIQFLRSYVNKRGDLEIGRLADSYDSEDPMEDWKKTVYKILKKFGRKIHWYYLNEGGEPVIKEKPETRLVAYPGAIEQYNGKEHFMVDGGAKYIDKSHFFKLVENK